MNEKDLAGQLSDLVEDWIQENVPDFDGLTLQIFTKKEGGNIVIVDLYQNQEATPAQAATVN